MQFSGPSAALVRADRAAVAMCMSAPMHSMGLGLMPHLPVLGGSLRMPEVEMVGRAASLWCALRHHRAGQHIERLRRVADFESSLGPAQQGVAEPECSGASCKGARPGHWAASAGQGRERAAACDPDAPREIACGERRYEMAAEATGRFDGRGDPRRAAPRVHGSTEDFIAGTASVCSARDSVYTRQRVAYEGCQFWGHCGGRRLLVPLLGLSESGVGDAGLWGVSAFLGAYKEFAAGHSPRADPS